MPRRLIIIPALVLLLVGGAFSAERFPPPDFGPEYKLPSTYVPPARAAFYEYLDVALLLGALSAASYLAVRSRSRRGLFFLTIFSVAYFGFWRKGCVCPVGATQNVTLALFDAQYVVPISIVIFFILPLIFTLFFGRTFCAAVCPLGAIQDLVLFEPVKVPGWLEQGLRLGAYLYLGAAVLFAATSSAFIICEYDPFVGFFRLSGSTWMILLGAGLLILGLFVGRPYCRFLCPYGVLLSIVSRFSKWSVTITPDVCMKCRLCEEVCPYNAIEEPAPPSASPRAVGVFAALLPVLVLLGAWLGSHLSVPFSKMHRTVALAERLVLDEGPKDPGTVDATVAFRGTGRPVEEVYKEALGIRGRFAFGSSVFGGFLGLVVGLKLVGAALRRRRKEFEIERSSCLACGRCFLYCPKEHVRRKEAGAEVPPEAVSGQM